MRPAIVLWALVACADAALAQPRPPGSVTPPLSPRNANYTIDARLDAAARELAGRETLVWTNISAAPARELQFHLYYNAWRSNDSTFMREARRGAGWWSSRELASDQHASMEIASLKIVGGATPADLTSAIRFIAPDDGNDADRTVAAVALPSPVDPQQTISVEIVWRSAIPRPVARTGVVGDDFFFGQWFPKIGVLQDDGRWNCHQFHATTEFFADFGVYDVTMRVPRGWPLAATGELRDRRDNADGTTSYRYFQEDVHDFAWTTSPEYVERRARFEEPGLPPVEIRLMMLPEHLNQVDRHIEAARAALGSYGEWVGPYPYGHLTIVDPAWQSAADGMEYPTLITTGTRWLAPRASVDPGDVTVHEAGHQWFYGMIASNEFEDAWMDEGVNMYVNVRVDAEAFGSRFRQVRRYFGGFVPWTLADVGWDRAGGESIASYREAAGIDIPSMPSYQVLAWQSHRHDVREAGAVAAHARTRPWLARDEPRPVELFRAVPFPASEAGGLLRGGERGERTRPHPVLRSGLPRVVDLRLWHRARDERSCRRRRHPDRRRRPAVRRRHLSGDRADHLRRRRPTAPALERGDTLGDGVGRVHGRGRLGADRSGPDPAPRHELHEQQLCRRGRRPAGGPQVGLGMDGVAAGSAPHLGVFRVTAAGAFADGVRRIGRAPALLAALFLATLITALPLSIALTSALGASFGHSLAATEALQGVNERWWSEFAAAHPNGAAGTFTTTVIGFAAVLDNLSTFMDRGGRPVSIVLAGGAYLLLWLFLTGGVLDRLARDRPTGAHEFFGACGVYFVRFLRLAPMMAAAYYLLFAWLHPVLLGDLYDRLTRDTTAERTAFFTRAALYAVFGLLLLAVNVVFDYAKVRAVVEDRRSMLGAVFASMRFVRRNAGAAAALYGLGALVFVAVAGAYAVAAPGAGGGGAGAVLSFVVGELYIAARLWIRLLFLASETALFQGRLAHAGYVAGALLPGPEPPIVERLIE